MADWNCTVGSWSEVCAGCRTVEESTNQRVAFVCRRLHVCTLSHGVGVFMCLCRAGEDRAFSRDIFSRKPSISPACLSATILILSWFDRQTQTTCITQRHTHAHIAQRHMSRLTSCLLALPLPQTLVYQFRHMIGPMTYWWGSLTPKVTSVLCSCCYHCFKS